MWRLLELRTRGDLRRIATFFGVGLVLGVAFAAQLDVPSLGLRLVVVVVALLLAGSMRARYVSMYDRMEKHLALHATLPLARRHLCAALLLEATLPTVAVTFLGAALVSGAGLALGDPSVGRNLWLVVGVGAWILVVEVLHVAVESIKVRLEGSRWRRAVIPVLLALLGGIVGFLAAQAVESGLGWEFAYALFVPQATWTALALCAVLAPLALWLDRNRPHYLS